MDASALHEKTIECSEPTPRYSETPLLAPLIASLGELVEVA